MDDDERGETRSAFTDAVNMTPKELEDRLETDESKEVGWKDDGGESVGHESGRRMVEIKRTKRGDLSDDDYEHMRKRVGYVKRHLARGGPDHLAQGGRTTTRRTRTGATRS